MLLFRTVMQSKATKLVVQALGLIEIFLNFLNFFSGEFMFLHALSK